MAGQSFDSLAALDASQQTPEHLRDAHLRLGSGVFVVLWPGLLIAKSYYGLSVHFAVITLISVAVAIFAGYLAWGHGRRNEVKRMEQQRLAREQVKQQQLDAFVRDSSK